MSESNDGRPRAFMEIVGQKGTATVEFAFIAPILLVLLIGVIEYGWVIHINMKLNNAVAYAAKVAVNQLNVDYGEDSEFDLDEVAKNAAQTAVMEYMGSQYKTKIINYVKVQTEHVPDDPRRITVYIKNWPHASLTNMMPDAALPGKLSVKAVMAYE